MPNFKPPIQSPKNFGSGIQSPPVMQITINVDQNLAAASPNLQQISQNIMEYYSSQISHFVDTARRDRDLGVTDQHSRHMSVPGLDMDYNSNQRDETLIIQLHPQDASPEVSGLLVDLNYDGYVAANIYNYVTSGSGLPNPYPVGPIDILINGYGVLTNYVPPLPPVANSPNRNMLGGGLILIVAFGPTALLCQSLRDATNENPLVPPKGPFPLGTPPGKVLPPRPDVKSNGAVPAHKDLPGYFVFNWADPLDPNVFAPAAIPFVVNVFGSVPFYPSTFTDNFALGEVRVIVQFDNAQKSPLNATGKNWFAVQSHFTPTYRWQGQFSVDIAPSIVSQPNSQGFDDYSFRIAEFYDRKSIRTVTQSWKYVAGPGGQILVNDKPLMYEIEGNTFGQFQEGLNWAQNVLDFDLTPNAKPTTNPDGNPVGTIGIYGNVNYTQALGPGSGAAPIWQPDADMVNPVEPPLVTAWAAMVAADIATIQAALTAAGAPLLAAEAALTTASLALKTAFANGELGLAYQYANTLPPNPPPVDTAALTALEFLEVPPTPLNMVAYCQAATKFLGVCGQYGFTDPTNVAVGNASAAMTAAHLADGQTQLLTESDYLWTFTSGIAILMYSAIGNTDIPSGVISGLETDFTNAFTTWGNYGVSNGQVTLGNSVLSHASTVSSDLVTYRTALLAQPALPAPIEWGGFKTIDTFKHRIITVTGAPGSYVFQVGPWQGG